MELKERVRKEKQELVELGRLMEFYGNIPIPSHIKGQTDDLHARMSYRLKELMSRYELEGIRIRKDIFNQVIGILKKYKNIK